MNKKRIIQRAKPKFKSLIKKKNQKIQVKLLQEKTQVKYPIF